ncbi:nuclear transport factor 2 family protein [Lysobacter niastensis]|uniref:Nuclear transport factor 2 family protein n=1 Tax=Lysobacter niastensis TaxID=380629 RepID=A0ABS0B8R8_9GAMM|nr:nuclear transport factor 2 family protein [Lysobacter niastensis]MBF6025396.1 nuclear transport factor 2 family protein [Lysobacter niastensis]
MNSAIEQVRLNKARYCRFLDTKQWEAFAALFVADAKASVFDPEGGLIAEFQMAGAFVNAARQFLEGARSIHQVHNDELELVSEDEISAIWSMEDYIVFPFASKGEPISVHGYGHYNERWVRKDGVWRISKLELRRTILELTPSID